MTEFDDYLWIEKFPRILRSPDHGQIWENIRYFGCGKVCDWVALNGRLYFGALHCPRWNEAEPAWEYFFATLPFLSNRGTASIKSPAVYHGVYMFDDHSERLVLVGL